MIDKIRSENMDMLFKAILTLETVDDCYKFFDDLCTSIELKSFAQRLQVAKLLDEHKVYNSIVTETGASTATISRVNRSLKDGNDGYELVFKRLAEIFTEERDDIKVTWDNGIRTEVFSRDRFHLVGQNFPFDR